MKNIKKIAGYAGGVFGVFLAAPLTVMAESAPSERSFGETMQYALLNTVMGIVIVFIVLVLIAWIISLFKYINKFEKSRAAKKIEKEAPQVSGTAVSAVPEEPVTEDVSDDLELAAVITAAVYAYEEAQGNDVPADGLVVRSIRKVNRARWQNA